MKSVIGLLWPEWGVGGSSREEKRPFLVVGVVAHARKKSEMEKSEISIYRPIKSLISKYRIDIEVRISAKLCWGWSCGKCVGAAIIYIYYICY